MIRGEPIQLLQEGQAFYVKGRYGRLRLSDGEAFTLGQAFRLAAHVVDVSTTDLVDSPPTEEDRHADS